MDKLPSVIIDKIASHLNKKEIINLSSSCKNTRNSLKKVIFKDMQIHGMMTGNDYKIFFSNHLYIRNLTILDDFVFIFLFSIIQEINLSCIMINSKCIKIIEKYLNKIRTQRIICI
jgi:hypothetical protein